MLNCQLSKIKNLKELKCLIPGHYQQVKNIVCLDKDCENKGLICIYCLQNLHCNHKFMGIEQYINEIMKFRQQEYQYSHHIECLRKQLNKRYQSLQLKITDLASNLEILTHQIKQKYEKDLDNIYNMSEILRQQQEDFITMQDNEDALSCETLTKFIDISFKFINYTYDDNELIKINNYQKGLSELDIYENRLDSIEQTISESLKEVQMHQSYLLQEDLKKIENLDISPSTYHKKIQQAHIHIISSMVLINHNYLYTASHDGYIKMWNTQNLSCMKVLKSSYSKIWLALVYLQGLNCLLGLTNDNTLNLINPTTLKVTKRIQIPSSYSSCPLIVQVPGCNNQVAVASGSKVFIIDLITSSVVHATDTNGYYVYSFDIWTDGNYKYIIYGDKAGKLYSNEIKTKTEMPPIDKAHEEKVVDVKVLKDSNYVITASTDKRIKVWKMPVMQYVGTWEVKGFVDAIVSIQNMLVVKQRDVDKLFLIYKDQKGSCKLRPFVSINTDTVGVFQINELNRSVVSSIFVNGLENLPYSDIVIDFY
ncbi:WD domain, G-beta repeat protein (macronuclear) [Tetrahymena thermophila SB210]|uniref:WD domain, G-beta repeat protein n=1 Tax=Tetrahymena thermophila (strain SB210) TaxID=312017 RepID=Q22MS5_TETTS|nr:WD domain, G-beta repeat protein [Tetrahymena thermophila SB210]EAR86562.1 WD domain, G-beta repeat protein [Tetrahymena thermophila SB210]|eukprot:XP_976945.1 WD domain, G-beta repeat protein [Tetrahymena thermophila SB210]